MVNMSDPEKNARNIAERGLSTQELMHRSRGRPPKADRKVNQTLRLDPDVLEAFRREGRGWQARINEMLWANIPRRQK
jgi:uncharacterized protein (DUF4415 family)